MSELSVDLVTPTGMVLEATLLPDDMRTEEVISELVDELNLPRLAANGQVINYSLEVVGQGGLPAGQTLRDAGVSNGDRLRLSTNHVLPSNPNAPRPQGPLADPGPTTTLAPGMLEVVLAVLDLNKSEKTALHADRPIAELIQQIAANYNLPARDKLNEVITYRLESKALGRYLANRETLQQAGIPRLDRLSLHREEHAGSSCELRVARESCELRVASCETGFRIKLRRLVLSFFTHNSQLATRN
jgi:hypothetical protein